MLLFGELRACMHRLHRTSIAPPLLASLPPPAVVIPIKHIHGSVFALHVAGGALCVVLHTRSEQRVRRAVACMHAVWVRCVAPTVVVHIHFGTFADS